MQRRYIKFQDNLVSLDTNNARSGVIPGSLYRGFDKSNWVTGLTVNIDHTITGEIRPDLSENDTPPLGVWLTRQGVKIEEDDVITVEFDTNAGNSVYRNDYLIGRHHHDVIAPGGINATYGIIKGPLNSDTLPLLSAISGNDWVILGVLRIPPNASNGANVKFKRSRIPSLGNQFPALLDQDNRYTAQQQEYQGGEKIIQSATIDGVADRRYLDDIDGGQVFKTSGDTFLDLLPVKPPGTEIQLYFAQDTTLRPLVLQLDGSNNRVGYSIALRPIVINYDSADVIIIKANQIATFRMYDKGGVYDVSNKVWGDFWKLISVSDSPALINTINTQLAAVNTQLTNMQQLVTAAVAAVDALDCPGNIRSIKWYGNIIDVMRSDGRGKPDGPFPKHQWCNGNLGTPDLRDVDLLGYPGDLSDYVENNTVTGVNTFKLTNDYILEHRHYIFGVTSGGVHLVDAPNQSPAWNSHHGFGNQDYDMLASEGGTATTPNIGLTGASGKPLADQAVIDVRGKRYYVLFIMRLPDSVILSNPY